MIVSRKKEDNREIISGISLPILVEDSEELSRDNLMPTELEDATKREIVYLKKGLSRRVKRRLKIIGICFFVFIILCFLFVFVVVPIIFMNSIELQRMLMFTRFGLPSEQAFYEKYEILPGLRNFYVSVKNSNNKDIISLGVWHLLPHTLENIAITETNFNFENALLKTNQSVLLYFHGTGEDRTASLQKYTLFRYFFHVITFDYRNYGDSSAGDLTEDAVVNDCVQLYEWLSNKTYAPVFIWGHSLGTSLATKTVGVIKSKSIAQPVGLILEAPFTRMSEELYVHPYGKIFSWLPYFEATIIKPLEKNGFIFDTSKYILDVDLPIMILSSEDDSIVPYTFGKKLHEIASKRTVVNVTLYYQFAYKLGYDHNFIYGDPFLPYFINYFGYICTQTEWKLNNETLLKLSAKKLRELK